MIPFADIQHVAGKVVVDSEYEWAVFGGGIAGIAISEILTREGHSVVLVEKNNFNPFIFINYNNFTFNLYHR